MQQIIETNGAFEVVAANKWFYQRLVVLAATKAESAAKFAAYLTTPEAVAHEEYELKQVSGMGDETDPETLERRNYVYSFKHSMIEEFEPNSKSLAEPTADVQMIDSGGNG